MLDPIRGEPKLSRLSKNIRFQMGRCPVRSIFPEALATLEKVQDQVE